MFLGRHFSRIWFPWVPWGTHVAISVGLSQVFWINPSAIPKYARMAVMWIFQMWGKYSTCNMRESTSMIHDGWGWRLKTTVVYLFFLSFSYLFGLDPEFGWGPRVVPDVNQDGHINTNHYRYRLYTVIHSLCGNSLWFFKRCFSSCWGMVRSPPWTLEVIHLSRAQDPVPWQDLNGKGGWDVEVKKKADIRMTFCIYPPPTQ